MTTPKGDFKGTDWATYPWIGALPPNRPGPEDINLLQMVISLSDRREIACALGSTPEYRQQLSGHFRRVDVIERSPSFKASLDWMMPEAPAENLVHGDWITELQVRPSEYDLIVSHFTHGNVSFEQRSAFYEAVARSLKPGGLFFDVIFQPRLPLFSAADIRFRFADAPMNLRTLNNLNCELVFLGQHVIDNDRTITNKAVEWMSLKEEEEHLRNLVSTMTKLVTPLNTEWDYSPARPPESLGYELHLDILRRLRFSYPSPFQTHSYCAISRGRR